MTLAELNAANLKRVKERATFRDGGYRCNACDSEIQQTTGYASVHDGPFPLSGSGRVLHYPHPYCPKCDGVPKELPRAFVTE